MKKSSESRPGRRIPEQGSVEVFFCDPSLPVFVGRPLIEGPRTDTDKTEVPHCVDCWVIYMIRAGQGRFHRGEATMPMFPGNVFLAGPEDVHWIEANEPYEMMNILFRPDELGAALSTQFRRGGFARDSADNHTAECGDWQLSSATFGKVVSMALEIDHHVGKHRDHPGAPAHRREVIRLLSAILRLLSEELEKAGATGGADARERRLIRGLCERMHAGYAELWTVARMVSATGLKQTRLFEVFKRETGKTPVSWLIDVRLQEARRLLSATQHTVTEVAAACGFQDPNYFSRIFRQRTGLSPRAFRRTSQQA